MATKRELYELLLDMSDCIDDLNKIFKTKGYSLEYDDEKIIYKQYSDSGKTIFTSEVDMFDALHPENLKALQDILETFRKACKDLANIKETYARLSLKINKEENLCRE